jgi:hypothetical protein
MKKIVKDKKKKIVKEKKKNCQGKFFFSPKTNGGGSCFLKKIQKP